MQNSTIEHDVPLYDVSSEPQSAPALVRIETSEASTRQTHDDAGRQTLKSWLSTRMTTRTARPDTHLTKFSPKSSFPTTSFNEWLQREAAVLSDILNALHRDSVGLIPREIATTIRSYTLTILPGIYDFEGTMDYSGIADGCNSPSDWSRSRGGGMGSPCSCQLILNSRAEIVKGHFAENSFKYHITGGTYSYDAPHCVEFTKEYFHYQVLRQLTRIRKFDTTAFSTTLELP